MVIFSSSLHCRRYFGVAEMGIIKNKRVFIIGVGRSGTTAIYNLLQSALQGERPDDVDFSYEPFLWDRDTFNKPFSDVDMEFTRVSSVSIEAIYWHKKLPLFCGKNVELSEAENNYLTEMLSPGHGKSQLLCKMIRSNGRLALIRSLYPDAKIIFLIRNPLDVINSSINMFSFYGDDFYEGDFDRFCEEIKIIYGENVLSNFSIETVEQREYLYWYFMNRSFLDEYKSSSENILPIAHDEFIKDRKLGIKKLCEFLGIAFHDKYVSSSRKKVGVIHRDEANLTKAGFDYIHGRIKEYSNLLECAGFALPVGYKTSQVEKYSSKGYSIEHAKKNNGFSGYHAKFLLNAADSLLEKNEAGISALQGKLAKKEASISLMHEQLVGKDAWLATLQERLEEKDEWILSAQDQLIEKDEWIASAQNQLEEKEKWILSAQKQLAEKGAEILTVQSQLEDKEEKPNKKGSCKKDETK